MAKSHRYNGYHISKLVFQPKYTARMILGLDADTAHTKVAGSQPADVGKYGVVLQRMSADRPNNRWSEHLLRERS